MARAQVRPTPTVYFPYEIRDYIKALHLPWHHQGIRGRVARFFLVHNTQTVKMYQMNTKCTKWS
jgi:hypothetical protein